MFTPPADPPSVNAVEETTQLTDLPTELLFQVFALLDDLDLYRLSSVCHALHEIPLDILFNRYRVGTSQGTLNLSTSRPRPAVLLPALHRALYLVVSKIFVDVLPSSGPRLVAEFGMLKDTVVRQTYSEALWINLTSVAWANENQIAGQYHADLEELRPGLQGLVDAALEKGCKNLTIDAAIGFKSLYLDTPASTPAAEVTTPEAFSFRLVASATKEDEGLNSDTRIESKSSHPDKVNPSSAATIPGEFSRRTSNLTKRMSLASKVLNRLKRLVRKKEVGLAGETLGREEPQPQSTSMYISPTRLQPKYEGRVDIPADLFTPTWLNWTLRITNHTNLVNLVIRPTRASMPYHDMWYNILPNIYAPHLEHFEFSARRLTVEDLAPFIRRHAETLQSLNLCFPIPTAGPESGPQLATKWTTAIYKISLPNLRCLQLPPHSIPPFLRFLKTSYLPSLERVTIQVPLVEPSTHSFEGSKSSGIEHHLDDALESLGKLIKAKVGSPPIILYPDAMYRMLGKERHWFSSLSLYCSITIGWLQTQAARSTSSPMKQFRTIETLCVSISGTSGDHTKEIFTILPQFLSTMPLLKYVYCHSGAISFEAMRRLDKAYWEGFQRACPKMETVQIQLPTSGVRFEMEDLINGTAWWPERPKRR
ncbi:hypothetical protein BDN72DRAFT_898337 [Pluteus cervinus]|uniref:Uncharacterized protein n=1 Tax=Pluteus cervinus TaxID=181527 RepID=A0ACD3ARG6_9AGAR|nr:hypothetical protein BDN72DRAFT_898337 [Pluteus cervinus]